MKVRLYARVIHLNRKDEKKDVEIQTFIVSENKTVKSFFLALMFYSPTGYLASRMF